MSKFVVPAAVVAVVLAPLSASAATSVSNSGLPPELHFTTYDCNTSGTSTSTYVHVNGPGTPPAGTGSLRFTFPKTGGIDFFKPYSGLAVSSFVNDSFGYNIPTGGSAFFAEIFASADGTFNGDYDDLELILPTTNGTWQTANLMTATLHWFHWNNTTQQSSDNGTTTWSTWSGAHGSELMATTDIFNDNCNVAAGTDYLDNLTMGDASATTWNFEAGPTPSVTAAASKSKIVAGSPVTLSTTVKRTNGTAVAGAQMQLLARKAGTSTFHVVATKTTNSSGVATSAQYPTLNTTYEWLFVGTTTLSPKMSTTKVVYVARKLTIVASDTTLTATQYLKVHGRETPAHVGSPVVIWRHNASGTFKIGSTTVKSDGTWAFAHSFPKGKWAVYATAPADSTHIASRSPNVTISSA